MLLAICLSLFRLYSDVMQGDNFAEESQGGRRLLKYLIQALHEAQWSSIHGSRIET